MASSRSLYVLLLYQLVLVVMILQSSTALMHDGADANIRDYSRIWLQQPDYEANSVKAVVTYFNDIYHLEVHLTDLQTTKDHATDFSQRLETFRHYHQRQQGMTTQDDWHLGQESDLALQNWILEPFLPHLEVVREAVLASKHSWTLSRCFQSNVFSYRLVVESGALIYKEQHVKVPSYTSSIPHTAISNVMSHQQQNMLKAFKSHELLVEWNSKVLQGPSWGVKVRHVSDNNQIMDYLYKPVGHGLEEYQEMEITALLKVQQFKSKGDPSNLVRIPSIIGYVEHDNGDYAGELAGIVLEYIDVKDSMFMLCHHGDDIVNDESKNRWKRQVTETLKWLHDHDIVWGDAIPHNVLIDAHGDAWLVNFEGVFSPGWIDEVKHGSIAGDLQGLEQIVAFPTEDDMKQWALHDQGIPQLRELYSNTTASISQ